MPKAFVVQDNPRISTLPIKEYADWPPRVIFPPGQIMLSPEKALRLARNVLDREMKEDDFLVLLGDPVMIAIVSSVAVEIFGKLKFLKWDRRERIYYPVLIDFDEGERIENQSNIANGQY